MEELITYKSFSELSYDKNERISLIDSDIEAIDFDFFTTKIREFTKSVDAIYIHNGVMECIEFKNSLGIDNSKFNSSLRYDVKLKFFHSYITLIENKNYFNNYKEIHFILVVPIYENCINRNRYYAKQINYIESLSRNIKVAILSEEEFSDRLIPH